MGFFDAVVIIVVIIAFVWLRTQKLRSQQTGNDLRGFSNPAAGDEELRKLRERISVLERIAFEQREERGLAREIERLRD